MLRLAALLTALAAPVAAQPSGEALLASWQRAWDAASGDLAAVHLDETLERTVDGPRGTLRIRTEGAVRVAPALRPRRSTDRARVDGEAVSPGEHRRLERRLRRALGPLAFDLRRPAALPARVLARAEPAGPVRPDRLGGEAAWRLELDAGPPGPPPPGPPRPPDRLTAWFSPSREAPRLLRLDRERRLPGGRLRVTTAYARHDGLDLPTARTVDAEVEQRRRLRTYVLTVRAEAAYGAARIERE